jgi:hypothetical protein
VLASRLRTTPFDPESCDAAARLGVVWVVEDSEVYQAWPHEPLGYPGVEQMEEFDAVTEVDSVGDVTLYRLRPCRRTDGTVYGEELEEPVGS